MSFASLSFCLFLPIVWCIYCLLGQRYRVQNILLLLASYVFYGWIDWRIVPLFIMVCLIAYVAGIGIATSHRRRCRNFICMLSTALILLNLMIFKYFNFFSDNVARLFNAIGVQCDTPTLRLVLPIGISFYTFQALGYIIDVYRGRQRPAVGLFSFLTFISFFPQLVAGPIERARDLLPQIESPRRVRYDDLVHGSRLILWGFFKKAVIADNCAIFVNEVWNGYQHMTGTTLIAAAVSFSFQIYCDFSGYSDIAIGSARLFGIRLSRNFDYPYYATNVADFWRRWNMTLMSWFRDYVYIPLGGNRCGIVRNLGNVWTVFLISGLWHGADWTFLMWGAYHAMMLTPRTLFRNFKKGLAVSVPRGIKVVGTFAIVTFGWILFRAPSVHDAACYVSRMVAGGALDKGREALVCCAVFAVAEWFLRNRYRQTIRQVWNNRAVRWAAYYVMAVAVLLLRGEAQSFIYFQF